MSPMFSGTSGRVLERPSGDGLARQVHEFPDRDLGDLDGSARLRQPTRPCTSEQMQKLATIEKGYVEKAVTVSVDGKPVTVRTFVAEKRERGLRPTQRYLNYLIEGAWQHGLPASYLRKLERVRSQA